MDWARHMARKFLDGLSPRGATINDGSSVFSMAMYFEDPSPPQTEPYGPLFPFCCTATLVHQVKLNPKVPVFENQISALLFCSRFYCK